MSQIEQDFRTFLTLHPELEECYQQGLINRRSLARHLIKTGLAKGNQLEAVIAMLRRYPFGKNTGKKKAVFKDIRINIKNQIVILDYEKDKAVVASLHKVVNTTNYDKGDTLKIVIGSASIKLFIDKENEKRVIDQLKGCKIQSTETNISEISAIFSKAAHEELGNIAAISKELSLNGVVISELLTATPELLIYLREEYVLKVYEILKRLQGFK